MEFGEDFQPLGAWNAWAAIGQAQIYFFCVTPELDHQLATLGRVLDRIVDQVEQDLFNGIAIAVNWKGPGLKRFYQLEAGLIEAERPAGGYPPAGRSAQNRHS